MLRKLLGAALLLALVPTAAVGQAFPSGPISILVPFEPGGPTDLIPRAIAPRLAESLGVPVTVENRPGAAGNVGAGIVAKSPPDGRRLLLFQGGLFTVNPWLFRELPFHPENDFIPITDLASTPNVIVVNAELKAHNVGELVQLMKAKPASFNYGTPGRGTSPHLCVELFKQMAGGLDAVHVPFKSGPAAVTNLLNNQVQFSCMNITAVLPSVKAQRLRVLAITTEQRSALLPEVPTMHEAGLTGFEVSGWFGLAAPAATPRETIARLNTEIRNALADPGVGERLKAVGLTILGDSPERVSKKIAAEAAKWKKLVDSAKIRIEE